MRPFADSTVAGVVCLSLDNVCGSEIGPSQERHRAAPRRGRRVGSAGERARAYAGLTDGRTDGWMDGGAGSVKERNGRVSKVDGRRTESARESRGSNGAIDVDAFTLERNRTELRKREVSCERGGSVRSGGPILSAPSQSGRDKATTPPRSHPWRKAFRPRKMTPPQRLIPRRLKR